MASSYILPSNNLYIPNKLFDIKAAMFTV